MASTNPSSSCPWKNSDLMAGFKLPDVDSVLTLAKQCELDKGDCSMEVGSPIIYPIIVKNR